MGSKPNGRTRRRVEWFTFPKPLPGPARIGKGPIVRDDVKAAAEYRANPNCLKADLERLLWDGFSSVFIHPDVMDSNFATTLVVANSNFHKVTWTMAGRPTVLGTTFEQGAFASNFFRIANVVELARTMESGAFPGIEVSLLNEFGKAVMLVRSGVEDSSPQLGVLRNELLGQLDFFDKATRLKLLGQEAGARDSDNESTASTKLSNERGKHSTAPTQKHLQAHVLHRIMGKNQNYAAEHLHVDQGSISRWVSNVEKWLGAGNNCPELPELMKRLNTLDPSQLDLGKRLDGKSKTARPKKSEN